ncbi:Glutaredoxin [Peptoniphilus sp. ING2-D1G]|nr:Glutaredoxin [Peptoniphilus sp. ING2-D1G]
MDNLKLYVSTVCPFCKKVERFIKKNNIEGIEITNIDFNSDARDVLVEKGGKKQVPALDLGNKIMYESDDIIDFLGNRE